LIVLHHLAFYGPIGDAIAAQSQLVSFSLIEYARMAVQVFLVFGGYLAARGMLREPPRWATLPGLFWQRYLRLALPLAAALLVAMAVNALTRPWLDADTVSAPVSWGQLAAHLAMLHSLLGIESISAGVWYVSIDLQLFTLLALLFALGQGLRNWRYLCLLGLLSSLFYFNVNPDWDIWGSYFFASYGLGALLAIGLGQQNDRLLLPLLSLLVCLALAFHFRERLLVALAATWVLAYASPLSAYFGQPLQRLASLGRVSYSVFLIHFPVCLLVNAALVMVEPSAATVWVWALVATLTAWLLSNLAGAAFYRWVELPCAKLGRGRVIAS
jgi:peptidoglycan/LPS O-acetylase OafA/YrhL